MEGRKGRGRTGVDLKGSQGEKDIGRRGDREGGRVRRGRTGEERRKEGRGREGEMEAGRLGGGKGEEGISGGREGDKKKLVKCDDY